MKPQSKPSGWTILFSVWLAQAIAAALMSAAQPADPEHALMFGLSAARWALLAGILAFGLIAFLAARRSLSASGWPAAETDIRWRQIMWIASIVVASAAQAAMAILRGLSQGGVVFRYAAYADRLAPLANLLTLCALELVLWMIWIKRDSLLPAPATTKRVLAIWLALGAVIAFAATTGIGVQNERVGVWAKPTIPFWEWQIVLAWLVGAALLVLEGAAPRSRWHALDRWWPFIIWLVVAALWIAQPINIGWLAGPMAPNFEIYPFSDAQNYDQYAQSILVGNGLFGSAIPQRPLYIVFLAALHSIVGQEYTSVIAAQSLVLALFPVALYLIGKEISGRPLGIMLAVLATLRDLMTNVAADYGGNFSFSKFYLSELPTALLLALFTLFLIRGARRPGWSLDFILAGGLIGISALVRTQALLLFAPVFLVAYLSNRAAWMGWLRGLVLMTAMIALALAPWVWRNWQITGGLALDDPVSQMSLRALNYHGENGIVYRNPGENDRQYADRLLEIALDGVRKNPRLVARLMSAHFLNNEFGNLLVFPVRDGLESPAELLGPTRPFWDLVQLVFSPGQTIVLLLYLLLFSLGIAEAWRAAGFAGLLPLALNLAYNFSLAVFMSSGMRFLLVADWGFYLYYALGLLVIARGLISTVSLLGDRSALPAETPAPAPEVGNPSWKRMLVGAIGFFLLACSIPLSEVIVPARYRPLTTEDLVVTLQQSATEQQRTNLDRILAMEGLELLQGRILYPRFYGAGEGETEKLGYGPMPDARLVFPMVGDANSLVIFDLSDSPEYFPHATDMVLVARREESHLQAQAVLVIGEGRRELYLASPP